MLIVMMGKEIEGKGEEKNFFYTLSCSRSS